MINDNNNTNFLKNSTRENKYVCFTCINRLFTAKHLIFNMLKILNILIDTYKNYYKIKNTQIYYIATLISVVINH